LNITPPRQWYCPQCGTKTITIVEEGIDRDHCSKCGQTFYPHSHLSVAGYVIKPESNQILLVQRARNPRKGLWSLPAGFCDYAELPASAIIREIQEETGLLAKSVDLVDMSIATDDHRAPAQLIFFFRVEVHPGKLINDANENIQIGWHNLHSLPELAWESQMYFLEKTHKPFNITSRA
jgi:8-oxo-dGTP diphosphatase